MSGQYLDPPISILDAGAGLDITFRVERAEIGDLILPANRRQQGGIVQALRLYVAGAGDPEAPPYWDITSRQLIAALDPLIPWAIERRRRIHIRALGTPPRIAYSVDLTA
jgi:hypothetical protein